MAFIQLMPFKTHRAYAQACGRINRQNDKGDYYKRLDIETAVDYESQNELRQELVAYCEELQPPAE